MTVHTATRPHAHVAPDIRRRFQGILTDLHHNAAYDFGFPGATDLPDLDAIPELADLGRFLLNNVGHPFSPDGIYRQHTKDLERNVVDMIGDLLGAPPGDRTGYVTTGSSESTLWALREARRFLPGAAVFASTAAHYSVEDATDLLGMRLIRVPTDPYGEIRYDLLQATVAEYRRHTLNAGVVVVASVGTTMTEAVDDVRTISHLLDGAGVSPGERWVHADAALAGIPLAFRHPTTRPGFTFADGADSVGVSGHKFLATPGPCGVVLSLASRSTTGRRITYTQAPNTTIGGSRSGHAPAMLWFLLQHWGPDGLRARADAAVALAEHTEQRLLRIGVPAWRAHRHAFTVVMPCPPQTFVDRWPIPIHGPDAHVVCMPGKTRAMADRFVDDLAAVLAGAELPPAVPC